VYIPVLNVMLFPESVETILSLTRRYQTCNRYLRRQYLKSTFKYHRAMPRMDVCWKEIL